MIVNVAQEFDDMYRIYPVALDAMQDFRSPPAVERSNRLQDAKLFQSNAHAMLLHLLRNKLQKLCTSSSQLRGQLVLMTFIIWTFRGVVDGGKSVFRDIMLW